MKCHAIHFNCSFLIIGQSQWENKLNRFVEGDFQAAEVMCMFCGFNMRLENVTSFQF